MPLRGSPPGNPRRVARLPAEDPERRSPLSRYLRYSHVGIQFFVAVVLFTVLGVWLDSRLGTGVLFTLLGLALGFGGGFYAMYRDIYPRARDGKDGPGESGSGKSGSRGSRG